MTLLLLAGIFHRKSCAFRAEGAVMKPKTSFKDLNLNNAFLFSLALSDPKLCQIILELIIGKTLGPVKVETEKSIMFSSDFRSIRLDVYASDQSRVDYDLEMQNEGDKDSLPKRSRLYQAEMDVKSINPGEDFICLGSSYIIFICTFDPFEDHLYRYTFENICHETGRPLTDGTCKIFLNTKGTNASDVSPVLIHFLQYVENSTDAFVEQVQDDTLNQIHRKIRELKASREWEAKYMKFEELLRREYEDGENIGEKRMTDLISFLLRDGLEHEIPKITADTKLRETYYHKYHL